MTTKIERDKTTFLGFVEKYLVVEAKCYRHCQKSARLVPIFKGESSLVGAYVCPDNYVSRVIYFAAHPDELWFKNFLTDQVGDSWLRPPDIRVATRHGWELGGDAEKEIEEVSNSKSLREYYWTFYPKSGTDKNTGTFLCANCSRLFTAPISYVNKLCENCTKK